MPMLCKHLTGGCRMAASVMKPKLASKVRSVALGLVSRPFGASRRKWRPAAIFPGLLGGRGEAPPLRWWQPPFVGELRSQGPGDLWASPLRRLSLSVALISALAGCGIGPGPTVSSLAAEPLPQAAPEGCGAAVDLLPPPDESEDRFQPVTMKMFVFYALLDRMVAAEQAMQAVRDATDLSIARCGAWATRDLLTGPRGRHGGPDTLFPGVLPGDGPILVDPGLALTARGMSSDERVWDALDRGVLGDAERWQEPSERWDEIDQAVTAWTTGNDSVSALDGQGMRVIAWARLAFQATSVDLARGHGSRGALQASRGLEAVREALAAACEETPDPFCEVRM